MAEEIGIRKDPLTRLRDYVAEVRVEMRRVTWPGWPEVYGTTVMVLITTFALGIYFSVCDMFFKWMVEKILHLFLH
jgi:preprotein translocase subunit SecE